MGAAPQRPRNNIGWVDTSLVETLCYPADLLDRPADEGNRLLGVTGSVFWFCCEVWALMRRG